MRSRRAATAACALLAVLAAAAAATGAADDACPSAPGAARAACFCKTVTTYKYYADTLNGCTGAMWCYGPGQSTYQPCASGLLFNDASQSCDWAANVKCSATPVPSPTPAASPSPALAPSPAPATPS